MEGKRIDAAWVALVEKEQEEKRVKEIMEEYNKLNPTAQVEWSEVLIAYKELQQELQQSG
jgi:hypothetical protein